ncbi:MAG TPA: VOC family protein [Bacteroidia bacterium]|nr:VOC family protein [Bacteroidia bacterium]
MNKIILLKLFVLFITLTLSGVCYAQGNKPTLNHVAICAHDLKKSVDFYSDVLELTKIANPFHDTVHQWFSIGPGTQLHVIQADCPTVAHDINNHLCLSVPSLEDFMKHLDKFNIKYGNWAGDYKKTQLRADGVVQIYFQDPDGYWIEVNNAK